MRFLADLRLALRTLLRTPGFFATSAGVLALGIAAVVVMFGFLRVTTTPPPLDRVDRVFALSVADARHHEPEKVVRLQDLEDWGREQKSFEGVAGFMGETVSFRREGASPERCLAGRVKGPFFEVLRVHPLLGRNLLSEDARPGASAVVVLSERLWRSEFDADPSVVGEEVRVNGRAHQVVGVAPAALDLPVAALLWLADRTDSGFDSFFTRGVGPLPRLLAPSFFPIGRLREGIAPEAGRSELQGIQARRVARYPEVASERPEVRPLSILWIGGEYQRLFAVLLGGVFLVQVLASVNVAGLLLVRGAVRTHEAAVRLALGAGRVRLAGQMLAESVVTGAAAALLGAVLAEGSMEVLRRVIPALLPTAPSWWRMQLDGVDLLVALGIGLAAALGAGSYPAIRVARVSVDPLLREGQRETGIHTTRLARWLVVVELALSAALLTAAGLVIRSGSRLGTGDVGVTTAGFLVAQVTLPPHYGFDSQRTFTQGLVARLRDLPGVEATAVTTAFPGITAPWRPLYQLADRGGQRSEELPSATVLNVGPGYFDTFRIPILRGRAILDSDKDYRSTVAVVSEAMARAAWPGESPVGKVLRIAPQETWLPPVTVVGVAKDVRYDEELRSLGRTPPVIYVPVYQWPAPSLSIALRGVRDPREAAEGIRRAIRQLDFEAPVFSVRTLDEERRRNAAGLTLIGWMFGAFGAVALALAASGVYAVVSYSVAQRARELAIRRALGAPRGRLLATVLARSGWQLALGLALGLALAPAVGLVVGTVVVQSESGLAVYLGVAAVLAATLIAAVLIPLRRALALEPSAALRHT